MLDPLEVEIRRIDYTGNIIGPRGWDYSIRAGFAELGKRSGDKAGW